MIFLDQEKKMDIFSSRIMGLSYAKLQEKFELSSSTLQRKFILIVSEIKSALVPVESDQGMSIVRTVLSLNLIGQVSSRGIEEYLQINHGIKLSHDTVLAILKLAAGVAKDLTASLLKLDGVKTASLDEIFQGSSPILNFVDNYSGVTQLTAAEDRSGDSWAKFLRQLQSMGLNPVTAIGDGGTGLKKGMRDANLNALLVLDLFHFLHKLLLAKNKAEGVCYALILAFDKATEEREKLATKMNEAIDTFDQLEQLFKKIKLHTRLAFSDQNQYVSSEVLLAELNEMQTLLEQFISKFSAHKKITDAKNYIKNHKPELIAYKVAIETEVKNIFGTDADFVLNRILPIIEYHDLLERSYEDKARQMHWIKQILQVKADALELVTEETFNSMLSKTAKIVEKYARSNSLVENINNQIRRYLDTYKTIPTWFCDLFSFYWNFHKFTRGKRAGSSPFELLTKKRLSKTWIDLLLENFPYHKLRLSNKTPNS